MTATLMSFKVHSMFSVWLCSMQEPMLEGKNEAIETLGRVDEGVEEFFTKKIIPDYAP